MCVGLLIIWADYSLIPVFTGAVHCITKLFYAVSYIEYVDTHFHIVEFCSLRDAC